MINKLIGNQKLRLGAILLLTPAIWWFIIHLNGFLFEWAKTPSCFRTKWRGVISRQRLAPIEEFRWQAFGRERGSWGGRLFYNKLIIVLDQFFDWTTFFSPRFYFQSGDGTKFSPQKVEPIPFLFFIFWVLGIFDLIQKKERKMFFIAVFSGLPGFIFGQKTMAFLFPVLFIYLYFINRGIGFLARQNKQLTGSLIKVSFFYSLFLIGRMLYLML